MLVKEQSIYLNKLWKMQEDVYHKYAAHCGLSSVSFWVLYSLYESSEIYTQNTLAELWCFPKQTVNSAISSLVKKGLVSLEQISGARNSKAVKLTPVGIELCTKIITPLVNVELRALSKMSNEERELFIQLSEKQLSLLQEEAKVLYKEENKQKEG